MANATAALAAELKSQIDRIVETAMKEGREHALSEIRALVGGAAAAAAPVKRGPGRPRKILTAVVSPVPVAGKKKKRKNPWAAMTPEQRKERVRKLLAGRGLVPKN